MPEPLDLEYLTTHAREQQTAAHRNAYEDKCPRCKCAWHGLPCRTKAGAPCLCPSSFQEQP